MISSTGRAVVGDRVFGGQPSEYYYSRTAMLFCRQNGVNVDRDPDDGLREYRRRRHHRGASAVGIVRTPTTTTIKTARKHTVVAPDETRPGKCARREGKVFPWRATGRPERGTGERNAKRKKKNENRKGGEGRGTRNKKYYYYGRSNRTTKNQ